MPAPNRPSAIPRRDRTSSPGLVPLITFVCRCDGHKNDPHSEPPYVVTLHEGEWAFCVGGDSDGHDWERVQACTIDEIRVRRRGRARPRG